jgi:hypothetical protein
MGYLCAGSLMSRTVTSLGFNYAAMAGNQRMYDGLRTFHQVSPDILVTLDRFFLRAPRFMGDSRRTGC